MHCLARLIVHRDGFWVGDYGQHTQHTRVLGVLRVIRKRGSLPITVVDSCFYPAGEGPFLSGWRGPVPGRNESVPGNSPELAQPISGEITALSDHSSSVGRPIHARLPLSVAVTGSWSGLSGTRRAAVRQRVLSSLVFPGKQAGTWIPGS